MATCSITDSFVMDADTFYEAVDKAQTIADNSLDFKTPHENPVQVKALKSEDIKMIFGG